MTYRVGNHQPRNLYRGDQYIGVMFDPADSELFVDAMEGRTHTPDVDHTNGGREALAWIRRELDRHCPPAIIATIAVRRLLDRAAAELGVDEEGPSAEEFALLDPAQHAAARAAWLARAARKDAPSAPAVAPQSDQNRPVVGRGANGAPKPAEGECDCGHEGLDAMFHLTPCPIAQLRNAARRLGYRLTLKEA